jgi:hypothetical protein
MSQDAVLSLIWWTDERQLEEIVARDQEIRTVRSGGLMGAETTSLPPKRLSWLLGLDSNQQPSG